MIDLGDLKPDWQSEDGNVVIYALKDPTSGEVRYVGKTSRTIARRVVEHITQAKRGSHRRVCRWIKSLLDRGIRPQPTLLSVVRDGWAEWERFWILWFRSSGCRLTNHTDGGEGLSGHDFSVEHRDRIASARREGEYVSCCGCRQRVWRRPSDIKKRQRHFCSRSCYQSWQIGKAKNVRSPHCGEAGRIAAAAKKRAQTRCKRGHTLVGENLYVNTKGYRVCKACRAEHKRQWRARNAA